jgi:hypothetical protein
MAEAPCDIPAITQTSICRVRSPLKERSRNVDTNGAASQVKRAKISI